MYFFIALIYWHPHDNNLNFRFPSFSLKNTRTCLFCTSPSSSSSICSALGRASTLRTWTNRTSSFCSSPATFLLKNHQDGRWCVKKGENKVTTFFWQSLWRWKEKEADEDEADRGRVHLAVERVHGGCAFIRRAKVVSERKRGFVAMQAWRDEERRRMMVITKI